MRWSLLLLLGCLPLQAAGPEIDRLCSDALIAWEVPGVTVAIFKVGEPNYVRGYGVREHGKPAPLRPDDVFPLASCTKAFTAALAVKLGILDDPVRKHVPEFHLSDPNADALVTIRDLLSHRTGVNGHDFLWYHAPWDQNEMIRRMGKLPLTLPFRGGYQYSTLDYIVVGKAIEKAGGKPWETQVREALTEPLEMKSVTFSTVDPAFVNVTKAVGHRRNDAGKIEVMPRYEMKVPNAAGSINLTARDLVIWMARQMGNKDGTPSPTYFKPTQEPQIVIPITSEARKYLPDTVQLSYGLGWIISDYRGHRVLSHGGMIDGFRTQILLLPDDGIGIALMNNMHDTRMNQALGNSIADHLLGLPAKDWNGLFLKNIAAENAEREQFLASLLKQEVKPTANTPALSKYAGEYSNPAYGTAKISVVNDELVWEWSNFRTPLRSSSDEWFRMKEGYLKDHFLEFTIKDGSVKQFVFETMTFTK